ncbi:MAG: ABC transporter substrate-binding protein [Acidimicrobiales bacterium]
MNERKTVGNRSNLTRRRFLELGAAGGVAAVVGAHSAGAARAIGRLPSTDSTVPTGADERFGGGGGDGTIRIGWVSPRTGPLAAFAAADDFVLAGIGGLLTEGLQAAGDSYTIEILTEDSQSDPNRAAEVALSLITDDQVNLMLVGNTPETTNPVADQCEATGVPCLSSVAPWQPWFFRSGQADPEAGYDWTYHFFWGLEDIIAVFLDMWSQVDHNGVVGALWPNDGDGIAWGDEELGFPPALTDAGLTLVDPGRYENLTQDFSAQIGDFRSNDVQILTGVPLPPDFTTFWGQAKQQGFTPRIASVGKALLFPDSVDALGDDGDGLSTEVWWSPNHPFASSLSGATCAEFAETYESESGRQWTQPIGFAHALFEVALDALSRAEAIESEAIRDALAATSLDTIVGPVAWGADQNVPKNVAKTPLVGGQWTRTPDGPFNYDMVIVSNADHPDIPAAGTLRPIPGS